MSSDKNITDVESNLKKLIFKIEDHDWGLKTIYSWNTETWYVYNDLSIKYEIVNGLEQKKVYSHNIDIDDFNELVRNIELAKFENRVVHACDGEAWEFIQYEDDNIVWKRELGYIYGIQPLVIISNILRNLVKNDSYIFENEKDKNNIAVENNRPQNVCGVSNIDFSDGEIIKETINVVIGNYRLSLAKCGNKCDLLYLDNSKTSYIKNSVVSISLSRFDEFCNKLKAIIADWNMKYSGDKSIVWNLKVDIDGLNKQIDGNGSYPNNWNDFIDLISEYEIIFKNSLPYNDGKND